RGLFVMLVRAWRPFTPVLSRVRKELRNLLVASAATKLRG
ncbi:MAG: hypothetical protein QOH21_3422, partial [Acidobacteriota bacterium]|nr:hypothetical protein [Acidobacteriota bacterium]